MRVWLVVLSTLGAACGVGVPPPCSQLPADRQFVCANRSTKSYCLVCYDAKCGEGKQQCFVRTSDDYIFSCDLCGGNRGCFEDDNAAINAWCSSELSPAEQMPTPKCGQQGDGRTCLCGRRATDLALRPVGSKEEAGGSGQSAQSVECKAYVGCYEATGGTRGSLDSTYGPSGACWSTTSAAANACTSACKTAIVSLMSAYPNAGCSAAGGPDKYPLGNVLRPAATCSPPYPSTKKCCYSSARKICACESVAGLADCAGSTTVDDCSKAPW